MDLPNLFSSATELETRIQICILLTDTTVQALLLKITMEDTKILHKSPVLTYTDAETLVIRTDESLQELGKESENINEVIFVLEPAWLKNGDVVTSKKPLLQKVTTELALRPVGFLLQSEALIQNLLSHNSHFSAVLLIIATSQISVSILSQGKVGAPQFVGRSADISSDLQEAFARYLHEKNEAHLPGKLICASFNLTEEELVDCQQKLLDTSWGEKAPFVQPPTIDIIKSELALSIVAQQAGNAVMGLKKSEMKPLSMASTHSAKKEASEMGFAPVSHKNIDTVANEERAVEVAKDFLPTSFGIPIKQKPLAEELDDTDADLAVELPGEKTKSKPGLLAMLFGSSKGGKHTHNIRLFIGLGFALGLIVLGIGGYFWLTRYSSVQITVSPVIKTVSSDVVLTLDPKVTTVDAENLRIPAQVVSKNLTTQTSGTTSGIKIVGDKAKGEVILYNKTSSQKTFPAGTVLQSGQLQYVLDKEITVEGAKEVEVSSSKKETTYGEAKVTITAYVIGVESNIGNEQELTVANFDKNTYVAQTTTEISGGSSREIRVVSQEDKDLLLSEAKKNLLRDAAEQFKAESGNGTYILPTEEVVITKASYSEELENPAEELALDVEGTVKALSYQVADLTPLAQAVLGSKVPGGYKLSERPPEILSAPSKETGKQAAVVLQANLSATAVPQLEPSSLVLELAGKPLTDVDAVLQNTGVIESNTLTFNPPLAKNFITKLPKDKNKIMVVWDEQ